MASGAPNNICVMITIHQIMYAALHQFQLDCISFDHAWTKKWILKKWIVSVRIRPLSNAESYIKHLWPYPECMANPHITIFVSFSIFFLLCINNWFKMHKTLFPVYYSVDGWWRQVTHSQTDCTNKWEKYTVCNVLVDGLYPCDQVFDTHRLRIQYAWNSELKKWHGSQIPSKQQQQKQQRGKMNKLH